MPWPYYAGATNTVTPGMGPAAMWYRRDLAPAAGTISRAAPMGRLGPAVPPALRDMMLASRPVGQLTQMVPRVTSAAPLGGMGQYTLPLARAAQAMGPYGRPVAAAGAGLGILGTALGLMDSERPAAPAPVYLDQSGNTTNAAGVPQIPAADPRVMSDPLAGDPEAQAQAANARLAEMLGLIAPAPQPQAQQPAQRKPQGQARQAQRPQPAQVSPVMAPTWQQRGFTQQPDGSWIKIEQVASPVVYGGDQ